MFLRTLPLRLKPITAISLPLAVVACFVGAHVHGAHDDGVAGQRQLTEATSLATDAQDARTVGAVAASLPDDGSDPANLQIAHSGTDTSWNGVAMSATRVESGRRAQVDSRLLAERALPVGDRTSSGMNKRRAGTIAFEERAQQPLTDENRQLVRAGSVGGGLLLLLAVFVVWLRLAIRQPRHEATDEDRRLSEVELPALVHAGSGGEAGAGAGAGEGIGPIDVPTTDEKEQKKDELAAFNSTQHTAIGLTAERAASRRALPPPSLLTRLEAFEQRLAAGPDASLAIEDIGNATEFPDASLAIEDIGNATEFPDESLAIEDIGNATEFPDESLAIEDIVARLPTVLLRWAEKIETDALDHAARPALDDPAEAIERAPTHRLLQHLRPPSGVPQPHPTWPQPHPTWPQPHSTAPQPHSIWPPPAGPPAGRAHNGQGP